MVFITDSLLQCMPGVSVYSLPLPQRIQDRRIRNVSFVLFFFFFLRETSGIKGRRATLNLSRKGARIRNPDGCRDFGIQMVGI